METKPSFKVLSKKEAQQVKGGGWLSNLFAYWKNEYEERKAAEAAAAMSAAPCPPPDPED